MTTETIIRFACFVAALALFSALERRWPRRGQSLGPRRWPTHLALVAAGSVIIALVPLGAAGAALLAREAGIGVLNQVAWPPWLAIAVAWVALDIAIYWQHRLMHRIPWLWRLHRVHHTDIELDASSALRFHPGELAVSVAFKMSIIVALGAPPVAVLLFETGLVVAALFNHANWRLSPAVDRGLRRWLVTPDMHRVHHSVYREETDSNFGNLLSFWDRIFGSYRPEPRDGHTAMTIGLQHFRARDSQRFRELMLQPLRGDDTILSTNSNNVASPLDH